MPLMNTAPASRSLTSSATSSWSLVQAFAQPELGTVGELDRLVEAGDPVDAGHRPEHLLRVHPHVGLYTAQHRRRVEPARPGEAVAAAEHLGALVDGIGHERFYVLAAGA